MATIPTKDAQGWASFNSRFRLILNPAISIMCFVIVWLGSVYGIQKMLEPQYPELSYIIGAAIALLVQGLNSVSVHFSTRMIAAIFAGRQTISTNQHQKVSNPDYFLGVVCLAITVSICYVDFIANTRGNEFLAEKATKKEEEVKVDKTPHDFIIKTASDALEAEKAAEAAEKTAWDRSVDADISKQRRTLEARKTQISGQKWATSELKLIGRKLAALEDNRKSRKAQFIPKKSDVAKKQAALAEVLASQSSAVAAKTAQADTVNTKNYQKYETKVEQHKSGLFFIYLAAMLLWHLCHGFKAFRALVYDEVHPEGGNPVLAIVQTLGNGMSNMLWKAKARIYDWMPEEEVRGLTSLKALEQAKTGLCRDVYRFILDNQGCNEMAIYYGFNSQRLEDVRHCLKVLKTAKLAFENSGLWQADKNHERFFFDHTVTEKKPPESAAFTHETRNFTTESGVDEAMISKLIDLLLMTRPLVDNKQQIDDLINILQKTIGHAI